MRVLQQHALFKGPLAKTLPDAKLLNAATCERPMDVPVEGAPFRRNYLREALLLSDSVRARRRLLRWFMSTRSAIRHRFVLLVESELGVDYPVGFESYNHERFWTDGDIADVLSGITFWVRLCNHDANLISEARRILAEEQLRYRLDDKGGVHFAVDEEFERTVQSALAGLGDPQYSSALHALQQGLSSLGTEHQSGKGLIRGVFEAVESAFLTVIRRPEINRISAADVDRHLKPVFLARYDTWHDANEITGRSLAVLKAWIHVGHYYRHGVPLEQIHEPPLDLAVAVASEGMAILRQIVAK